MTEIHDEAKAWARAANQACVPGTVTVEVLAERVAPLLERIAALTEDNERLKSYMTPGQREEAGDIVDLVRRIKALTNERDGAYDREGRAQQDRRQAIHDQLKAEADARRWREVADALHAALNVAGQSWHLTTEKAYKINAALARYEAEKAKR